MQYVNRHVAGKNMMETYPHLCYRGQFNGFSMLNSPRYTPAARWEPRDAGFERGLGRASIKQAIPAWR